MFWCVKLQSICHCSSSVFNQANLKDDEVAQLATDYTAGEIAFFKAVVSALVSGPSELH